MASAFTFAQFSRDEVKLFGQVVIAIEVGRFTTQKRVGRALPYNSAAKSRAGEVSLFHITNDHESDPSHLSV